MSRLIRDNKNILNFLVKKAYPYRDVITTTFSVHYYVRDELACCREAFRLHLKTTMDMYTWVEVKHNLFYCIDINKLMRYNNLRWIGLVGTTRFDSVGISGELLRKIMNSITSSFNNTNLEAINRMLHFYGIIGDIVSSILRTLQSVEFISSMDEMMIDTCKLPLLRYDTMSQYVYIPYYSYIYIVRLMSYKGSDKDYRNIISVSDIVNNTIPTNVKHWFNKDMRLILNSRCVCNIDIEGNY